MRKPMMAGNWKMNKTIGEAVDLAASIRDAVGNVYSVDKVVCPTFVCLPAVNITLSGSDVAVGAQNMHWEASGAYTGEVSAAMLEDLATYVIIGHSERREYFAETDETVNKKTKAALAAGLKPIVCVGESLEQNQAGETADFVGGQVRAALADLSPEQVAGLVIAYEPIWAIGTGLAATAQQAQDICGGVVRAAVGDAYGDDVAQQTRVLYGGSTKPGNIDEIMQQPDIDGALIGGAALDADSYAQMVKITADAYDK
ncbi:MAG: triose-phosphate isomerase [Caldilineaceae bacterium]|nr:triose-phosphate isomerase [Caldilineaceae bacterium]